MSKHTAILATLASFIATRTVNAKPMNRQEYNDLRGWQVPDNENPADDGYLVVNSGVSERNVEGFDGYVSWLPKVAFEEQYKNTDLSFGQAVEFLKQGKKVARKGWNGKGMWLLLVDGKCVTEVINDCYGDPQRYLLDASGCPVGQSTPVLDAIYMKTADNKLVPWLASQTDVLAEYWVIVG